jgi:hypothetical protein
VLFGKSSIFFPPTGPQRENFPLLGLEFVPNGRNSAPKTASNLAPYADLCRGREFLLTEGKQRSAYVSGSGVPRREELAKTHQIVRNNILFSYQPPLGGGMGAKPDPFQGPQTPNSWSPAGRGNSGNSPVPGQTADFPPNRAIPDLGRKRPNSSLDF